MRLYRLRYCVAPYACTARTELNMYGQLTTVLFLNPRARRTKLVVRGTGLKFTPPDQTQVHELKFGTLR